ncbi:MAG: helix-turn-helix domain-containing protein [Bacteroidales bacterium]
MMFGERIKELREYLKLPQRQLAAVLEIDTATYCKIERGDRRAKRVQVLVLADYFNVKQDEFISLWLADKIIDLSMQELNCASSALVIANNFLKKI